MSTTPRCPGAPADAHSPRGVQGHGMGHPAPVASEREGRELVANRGRASHNMQCVEYTLHTCVIFSRPLKTLSFFQVQFPRHFGRPKIHFYGEGFRGQLLPADRLHKLHRVEFLVMQSSSDAQRTHLLSGDNCSPMLHGGQRPRYAAINIHI